LSSHKHTITPETQIALLGLRISKALFRSEFTLERAFSRVVELFSASCLFQAVVFEIRLGDKPPSVWGFEEAGEQPTHCFSASFESALSGARIWLEAGAEFEGETLKLLAEYAAQQLGRAAEVWAKQEENQALRTQIRLQQESLDLRKLMDRAKAILTGQGPLTAQQAEEFLVAASVRSGKPLVRVAREIILALGEPTRRRIPWRAQRVA
jgi:hypothetical protein